MKALADAGVKSRPIDEKTSNEFYEGEQSILSSLARFRATTGDIDHESPGGLTTPPDHQWTKTNDAMVAHMYAVVSHMKRPPNNGAAMYQIGNECCDIK